jgi:hypothetical protein
MNRLVFVALIFVVSGGCGNDDGSPSAPSAPTSWIGPLPTVTNVSGRLVCSGTASFPSTASCVNDITGPPTGICVDRRFTCSTGSGTCSSNGGVYCWKQ